MGANLCTLKQSASTQSSKNGGIPEKREPGAAASLWELVKPACLESTGIDDDGKKRKNKKSLDGEAEAMEVVKIASICGESTKTLSDWLLASPVPQRRDSACWSVESSQVSISYKQSSSRRRVSPWISEPPSIGMEKHAQLVSPLRRLPGAVLASAERENHRRAQSMVLLTPSCWDDSIHDQGDKSNLCGARDSICIERERRLGEGSAAVAREPIPCLVKSQSGKMKKKVSFRLPKEADIFVFYSPAHNDDDS